MVTSRPLRRGSRLAGFKLAIWPLLALVALLLFNLAFTPGFFDVHVVDGRLQGSLIDVLKDGAPTMMLAMGMTLVIATGGIDLSVGSIMAIAGAVAVVLIRPAHVLENQPDLLLLKINVHGSLVLIVGLALVAAFLAGVWNGALVAAGGVQPIVATLIFMIAGRGIAQLCTHDQKVNFEAFEQPAFQYLGAGLIGGFPFRVLIAVGVALLTGLLIRGTALGLFIESIGNNATASWYAGVNARVVKILAYTWCGLCAGVAGIVTVADLGQADVSGLGRNRELDAILAAAIGGTSLAGGRFSLLGSFIGALVIQLLERTILQHSVPPPAVQVVKACVVVAVCLLQSDKFRALVMKPVRRGGK